MRWQHEVDANWLDARRQCLTATDILKLWPAAKKWKAEDEIPQTFIGTWFEKNSVQDQDPISYDAAARGHCMEPFAIEEANRVYGKNFYHWDDVLIVRGHVGFSPDAMDIPQPNLPTIVKWSDPALKKATEIMEVKCFLPYHHGQCVTCGMEEKQIMQVAMAFKVLPQLEEAHVLYYCPGAPIDICEYPLSYSDINPYIQRINKVVAIWNEMDGWLQDIKEQKANYTEREIHELSMGKNSIYG